jgi:HAE1 family hydrophobic/amphiphilic exporter-1
MEERGSLLPRISVARPVTVTMCLLALLVVGAVAYLGIRVEMMPSGYTHPYMHVRIRYPNATPQEVEQQITRPLEERLRTIKGIERIRTYTGSWGVSAPLRFQQDADMTLAYNQLMDQIERLKLELPDEARDQVRVWKHNDDDNPIMWIGMLQSEPIADPYRFLVSHVQLPLERIDGVAKVELWGADKKEVMIELDRERLQARGVNTYEVAQTLMADNFALAGGHVREAGKKFYVRSLARYRSLEEIRNIPVSRRNGGVRLHEVADVVYDVPERTWRQRINRMPASSLGIKAESRADIVKVCDRVVRALREIEKDPVTSNLEFNVFFDQGRFIRESIDNLQNTGMWGGLFAACVLLFFLRALRMTAIITLAIPLCVMITVATLYFMGWSLNLMTMMGLMVGVGMVVDNAIVILENIYRMREKGEQPRDASVSGSSEVALAITMATMTTVVVFLPLIFMSGNVAMRFYFFRLGMPVMAMLLGSLFVALLFIPLAATRFGGAKVKQDPRSIGWARSRYGRALAWTLRRRRDALLIALVLFATVVYPSTHLKRSDSKGGNINDVDINVRGPRHFTVADTEKLMDEIEDFLETKREAYGIRTIRTWYSEGRGGIQMFLESSTTDSWWYVAYRDLRAKLGFPVDRQMARTEVIKDLKKHMPKFVGVWVGVERWGGGGGGGGNPSVGVNLYGEDTEELAELIDEVDRRLRTIPSVVSVDTDLEQASDEVQVRIDRDRAHAVGISPRVLGRTLAFSLQGVPLPKYQSRQREVDTRLYLEKADRQTLHQLKNLTFRSRSGEEIPLSELA